MEEKLLELLKSFRQSAARESDYGENHDFHNGMNAGYDNAADELSFLLIHEGILKPKKSKKKKQK